MGADQFHQMAQLSSATMATAGPTVMSGQGNGETRLHIITEIGERRHVPNLPNGTVGFLN